MLPGRLLAVLLVLGLAVPPPGEGHLFSVSYTSLRIEGETVNLTLTTARELLRIISHEVKDPHNVTGPIPDTLDQEKLARYVSRTLRLFSGGEACTPSFEGSGGSGEGNVTLRFRYRCPGPIAGLILRSRFFLDYDENHQQLAKLEGGRGVEEFVLNAGSPEHASALGAGPWVRLRGQVRAFTRLGLTHILTGYDHLLFIAGLVLGGGGIVNLVKVVTAFTVAHSLTLGTAVLDVVTPPARWGGSVSLERQAPPGGFPGAPAHRARLGGQASHVTQSDQGGML